MKFAKQYSEAYRDLPPEWPAFQYKALKKTIRSIVKELEEKGISVGDNSKGTVISTPSGPRLCTVEYFLEGSSGNLEPFIIINIAGDDEAHNAGLSVEANPDAPVLSLSDQKKGVQIEVQESGKSKAGGSRSLRIKIRSKSHISLKGLLSKTAKEDKGKQAGQSLFSQAATAAAGAVSAPATDGGSSSSIPSPTEDIILDVDDIISTPQTSSSAEDAGNNVLKLFLEADQQFFSDISSAVTEITVFENTQRSNFNENLETLSRYLASASSPYSKDMYAWRTLLSAYLQSEIWLVNGVKDRPLPSSKQQLLTFAKIVQENMRHQMKAEASMKALRAFLAINHEILALRTFEEINHMAVRKILKKHDKRTHLTASEEFSRFSQGQSFFMDNIARALIFSIQERLVTVIPQPDDYACPICQDVAWKPIRLTCGHVFCVRCLVKAQVREVKNCPVCRSHNAIEDATPNQLDVARMNLLKLYFPKEVKQKALENGRERATEELATLFPNGIPQALMSSSPSAPTAAAATSNPVRPRTGRRGSQQSVASVSSASGNGTGCVVM
ncbi:SPX domain-containing protein [Fimicolochytrium jonesii]|uniref:SPX domain-containing protein n=1 Tax=Fimicolochytrium jonesii TaxID=1396493 RepID=UPI0022FE0B98|nr:SPX domain-containing protein [Fimicolochytrium jonesii]KAI8816827.1 SPX domain-containing protein [Fimicolochytrium jonesii]